MPHHRYWLRSGFVALVLSLYVLTAAPGQQSGGAADSKGTAAERGRAEKTAAAEPTRTTAASESTRAAAVAETSRTAVGSVPEDVLLCVTLRDGKRRLEELRASAFLNSYYENPAYAALAKNPEYLKAQGGLYFFAGTAGLDPWGAVGQLLGKELVLAVGADGDGKGPWVLSAMKAAEPAAVERLYEVLLAMSGATAGGEPVEAKSRMVEGVRGYQLTDDAFVAMPNGLVMFANRAAVLEKAIRAGGAAADTGGSGHKPLAMSAEYKQAAAAVPENALAWAYVNLAQIKRLAGEKFDKKIDNPLGAMLVAGWLESIRAADSAAVWLEAGSDGVSLAGRLFGGAADGKALKTFMVASGDSKDWSKFDIPGLIGQIRLSRDWTGLWDIREEIIDAEGIRGLSQFASILTTLMGNLDFSAELLPELKPTLRFIAARQEFAGEAPTPQLPGFALLLHMKDAGKLGPRLENAAMMALSVINVDMGQKMQPQFSMTVDQHGETKMLIGKYPEKIDAGPRGIRYNFEPSIAAAGEYFVISTSRKMLENIIDSLAKLPQAAEAAGAMASDSLTVDLRELYRVFDANREVFVTNRMVEEDIERETAAGQVSVIMDAAKMLSDFSLVLKPTADGLTVSTRIGVVK